MTVICVQSLIILSCWKILSHKLFLNSGFQKNNFPFKRLTRYSVMSLISLILYRTNFPRRDFRENIFFHCVMLTIYCRSIWKIDTKSFFIKYYNNQTVTLLNPCGLIFIVPILVIPAMLAIFEISAAKEYESLLLKLSKGKLFHDFIFAALLMQIKVNLFHKKYMMKFLWVLMWLYFFVDKIFPEKSSAAFSNIPRWTYPYFALTIGTTTDDR